MTRKRPNADREFAEASPPQVPATRRPKRLRGDPKLYISFLPEGKGGPREDKGSVPLEVDVGDHIEERSDCEPGIYRIEKKRSGEFSGEVLFYTKDDIESSSVAESAGNDSSDEISSAEFIPRVGESLSASDIARLVSSAVNATLDVRDKRARQAEGGEPTVLETLRELEEMAERRTEKELQRRQEMRSEIAALIPKDEPLSAEQQLRLAVVEKSGALPMIFRELREALGTAGRVAEQSWGDKLLDFVKDAIPYVGPTVGPAIGAKLVTLLDRVPDAVLVSAMASAASPQATAQSAQSRDAPSSDERPLTLDDVIFVIKQEIIANGKPKESVDSVVQLIAEQPQLLPIVEQLLGKENQELLAILSEATRTNLTILANASKFVDGLRAGVRSRLQVPPADVTGNGHKATTASTAAGAGA